MTTIMVFYNLKPGVSAAAYEAWAKSTDFPTVRALKSVTSFETVRATGLLGGDGAPPYQYAEAIKVSDMDLFGQEIAGDAMQKVAAEFQTFADNPVFMLCQSIEGAT